MPFDFQLTFTGLCALIYEGDKAEPDRAAILLTKADHHHGQHRHVPLMSYDPRDVTDNSSVRDVHRFVPNPLGDEIALVDLRKTVQVGDPDQVDLTASWGKSGPTPKPYEKDSLDWLPPLYGINRNAPGIPTPNPNAQPNHGLMAEVARIEIKGGHLKAADLTKGEDGAYVLWEFVYPDLGGSGDDTQNLANKLQLEITGLKAPLPVYGDGWKAKFYPAASNITGRVEVSITNLPDGPVKSEGERLEHFGLYYDMLPWSQPKPVLRLPKIAGASVTGSSSVCPPTRWDD